jgi:hypothetical protein
LLRQSRKLAIFTNIFGWNCTYPVRMEGGYGCLILPPEAYDGT